MKFVVFLGDGMGDFAQPSLGGKTALEQARKPNMDRIAREGVCGLLRAVPDGMRPESTVANLSVMGYDPRECFSGRGVLEAAAMGVELAETDHAARLNLIHVAEGNIVSHSAGNVTSAEAAELVRALDAGLALDGVTLHPGVSYRHVIRLTRPASAAVECAAPHDHLDEPVRDWLPRATAPEGEATAELLRDVVLRSGEILEDHPVNRERRRRGELTANFCWPWSIGRRPRMRPFADKFGVRGAVVAAVDLIRGIGLCAGMAAPSVEGATGLWDTNYENKADAALALLEDRDLVYIHVEAPDEAGHEGDLALKVRTIEDLDARLIARVMARAPRPARFAVLPDHYTPVSLRTHVPEPVPFAMMGPGLDADGVEGYSERACAAGRHPDLAGEDFMRRFTARE